MSSLLFWGPYLTHKAIVGHKREKKRQKNYERWEGLRDEYDDMKRVTGAQQRQSLEYQPTGTYYPDDALQQQQQQYYQQPPRHSLSSDRDLFTLRDQQEAGDARMAWTPQERWQQPYQSQSRPGSGTASVERLPPPPQQPLHPQYTSTAQAGPLPRQKTGATWDEGLPPPMRVVRQNWGEENGGSGNGSAGSSRVDVGGDRRRRSGSIERERDEEEEERLRKLRRKQAEEEVQVVESPYDWWK